MKKIRLILVFTCLLPLLGLSQTKHEFVKYIHPESKYEISYPKEWKVSKEDNNLYLFAPVLSRTDTWSENMIIKVSANKGMSLKQLYQTYVEDGIVYLDKFKKIDAGEEVIDTKIFKWILFSSVANQQGNELVNLIYMTSQKDKMYVLTSTLHPSNYSEYVDKCKEIIKTFRIL